MDSESPDSTNLLLDQKLELLSQLAEHIANTLAENRPDQIHEVLEELSTLSSSLFQISHLVADQIEDRDNHLALVNISRVVNSSLHLDEVLRIVMDTIVRLTGAERGFLMLRDTDDELSIHIARNWEQETLEASENALSRTVVERVLSEGSPILTTNARQDPRFDHQESVISLDLRSILCVPLRLKASIIGVIYADNRLREGLFTEVQKDLLAAFANQAAIAIENARLFESIESTLAEVTGLKNLMDDVFYYPHQQRSSRHLGRHPGKPDREERPPNSAARSYQHPSLSFQCPSY
jgi:transcriptional regulator with GAF, ATPase, and Fis domain